MIIFAICYSLFFWGIGSLAGRYPTLISGISTMSAQKRKNVDLPAIGQLYKIGLTATGVAASVVSIIFSLLDLLTLAVISLIAITLIGAIVTTILGGKYNKNPQSKLALILSTAMVAVVIAIVGNSIYTGAQPTQVAITESHITFTGKYGIELDRDQIREVELCDSIPRIKIRVNGIGLGNILKGEFNLEELGRCRLFLNLPHTPYLYIELENNKKIIFNSKEPGYTERLYNQIKL